MGNNHLRVGIGYDVHRLEGGRPLIIGGVKIPFEMGLQGHSDADVLAHAICDAVLGAAGMGDIGCMFPDTDPEYRNIRSLELLRRVVDMTRRGKMQVVNIDATVMAEAPKLAPYRQEMEAKIASAVSMDHGRVNVKATTTEGLGWIGRREGIGAMAIALLTTIDASGPVGPPISE
ncbi:2-C-methyl-D-erythritol 2,4-cyclodiphosphate synthase (EC [Olavius algarvensis associated proteobacterium Delta 3]|nr:2-C-methyl-D-erythritol 2,4-cyclodiphosphate synthase (EC [Olavius algarvensis associated proteobacterium Delta 3]CAB5157388.1 2-C-methyl-D-erythritol 2,4-cyclodiphosphate synthase (EC [Olavius algarvensis associated proteobacterium Delta 3]